MKADKVHPAGQPPKQRRKRLHVAHRVVHAVEEDVLERHPPAVRKVVLLEQRHHLLDRAGPLGRHQSGALLGKGRMQAHG